MTSVLLATKNEVMQAFECSEKTAYNIIKKTKQRFKKEPHQRPTLREVAEYMGVTENELRERIKF